MPFKPGQSGNPNGRPKGERALAAILETTLNKTVNMGGDHKVAAKRAMAALVVEGLTTGRVTFPDRVLEIDTSEWLTLVRMTLKHIDGEKTSIDVTSLGESMVKRVEVITPDPDALSD